MHQIKIQNPSVNDTEEFLEAKYNYETSSVTKSEHGLYKVTSKNVEMTIRTEKSVPRVGVMLVGWGGNNGTTLTAALLANRLKLIWKTRRGFQKANFFGSIFQASTMFLGMGPDGEVYVPFRNVLPLVDPIDLAVDGWDISSMNLADAVERARVLDCNVQVQLRPFLEKLRPRPSVYMPEFIAANQADRADNVLTGTKWEQIGQLRLDIKDFKQKENLDKVIVMWTANTERFCEIHEGLNDTSDNLMNAIANDEVEISPSTLYAVASVLEGCAFINGSPQNTFVPGLVELAEKSKVFIGGDDFKSGQTKLKSVLVDFLLGAGIKPVSIVSYNHLGNNDGKNLSAPKQFRAKEMSKRNIVDDMVASNSILYEGNEKPDHCVVIKYVPYVGDSKRAMDEYTSEIMLGGHSTIVVHNTCEDSLLASPIILDLVLLTEICQRITFKVGDSDTYQNFHSVLAVLSYFLKAPLVPDGSPLVNGLFKQRSCIENLFRAAIGLPPVNHLFFESRLENLTFWKNDEVDSDLDPLDDL